jgi:hypothetical protein
MQDSDTKANNPWRQAILRNQVLQPGDVLLTRGQGFKSAVVARATGGSHSHAAIWLPDDGLPLLNLYESDGQGVGPTHLQHVHVKDGPQQEIGYLLPGEPGRFALWRHPGLGALPLAEVLRATTELKDLACFRRYARLHRLSNTLLGDSLQRRALRVTARLALPLIDPRADEPGHEGIFCSELVGLFFQMLNLPLFDGHLAPERISPNHLAGEGSQLREVPNAFFAPQAGLIIEPGFAVPTHRLRQQIDAVSRQKQSAEAVVEKLDAFSQAVMARSLAQGRQLAEVKRKFIADETRAHLLQTQVGGDVVFQRRLPHLMRLISIGHAHQCLVDWTSMQEGQLPVEQHAVLVHAHGCLLHELETRWVASLHAYNRAAVLDALRLERRMVRAGLRSARGRRRTQKQLLRATRALHAPVARDVFADSRDFDQEASWPLIRAFTEHWLAQPAPTL